MRESEVTQSCPTPSYLMDCSPPGSSIHGIFQARVLEWVAITFSDEKKASLVAQREKRLPAVQEMQVLSLGLEGLVKEGNDTPLQYSCLEDPMGGGAW